MVNHEPGFISEHEDVGSQYTRRGLVATNYAAQVLRTDHPCTASRDRDKRICNLELDIACVAKDNLPAGPYVVPPTLDLPPGMDTYHALIMKPYLGHLPYVQVLESAIKTLVGPFDVFDSVGGVHDPWSRNLLRRRSPLDGFQ